MPYAPTEQRQDDQFLYNGMTGAAQTRLAGTQALASGIASGAGSIGSSLTELDKIMAKNQANMGALDALKAAAPQIGISQEELDSLAKIHNPDKLAGALSMYSGILDQRMKQQYLDKQLDTEKNLAAYKYSLAAAQAASKPASPSSTYLPSFTFDPDVPSN